MQRRPLAFLAAIVLAAIVLVASGCTGTGSASPGAPAPSTAVSGTTARLLFNRSVDDARQNLLVLDVATGELLADPWTDETRPMGARWTPDGSSLVGTIPAPDFLGTELAMVPLDPSRPAISLASASFFDHVEMSPDGRWVAYLASGPAADLSTRVMLVPADGSAEPTVLVSSSQVDDPPFAWAPDGRRLAAVEVPAGQDPPKGDVVLLDVPSGTVRRFEVPAVGGLQWSPGGRQLAFAVEGYPSGQWVLDVESGAARKIVPDEIVSDAFLFQVAWVDEATLVGVKLGESTTVYHIRLGDGAVEPIATLPGVMAGVPAVSPDGGWVALTVTSTKAGATGTSLSAVSMDDGHVIELTRPTPGVVDMYQVWQPVPADVPWEPWSPPASMPPPTSGPASPSGEPGPTPELCEASGEPGLYVPCGEPGLSEAPAAMCTLRLDVVGDHAVSRIVQVPSEADAGELWISGPLDPAEDFVGLTLANDGRLLDFGLQLGNASFEAQGDAPGIDSPAGVVLAPGSGQASGSLSFTDLASMTTGGSISGTVAWTCPAP